MITSLVKCDASNRLTAVAERADIKAPFGHKSVATNSDLHQRRARAHREGCEEVVEVAWPKIGFPHYPKIILNLI